MADATVSLLDRIRNPEYTGENRCIPCTVVNLVIAGVASGLIAFVRIDVATALFVLSLPFIYFRGYLVPGTPALTKRYLPQRLLAVFDKHPAAGNAGTGETWETIEKLEEHRANAVDPEQFLVDADVVEPGEDGDEPRLTDGFSRSLERRIAESRDDAVDLARVAVAFDAQPANATRKDRDYPAIKIGRRVRRWPSEAALVADVAAHEALDERTDRWTDVPLEQRQEMLATLRSVHETCPACDGDLGETADTVESCCGTHEVIALACRDCGDHLSERSPDVDRSTKFTRR